MENLNSQQLYRTLWRWHFYAGVFALPFVVILAITGAIYLFKPQLDAIHDAPYRHLLITGEFSTPEQQVAAALAAVPHARFTDYELPRETGDAVNILLNLAGEKIRVYVHPQTLQVVNVEKEEQRFVRIVHQVHGELLMGKTGSVLVELAACWAIVLVLTGIYLWFPRNANGLAGVLYPRFSLKGRLFWRDLYAVIGLWISCFVLFLLLTALPWAVVWGSAFKEVRALTGTAAAKAGWNIAGRAEPADEHAEHNHADMGSTPLPQTGTHAGTDTAATLDQIVGEARALHFAYPVLVTPPSRKSAEWTVTSDAQNRPLRADAAFDAQTGALVSRQVFSQRHILDRIVGIGVAAHEGQLFGWINQLLGLLTAAGLVAISVSGFVMWRKRAPDGVLGAPPAMPDAKIGAGFVAIITIAAILLPVLGASLIVVFLVEKFLVARWSRAHRWLGLEP